MKKNFIILFLTGLLFSGCSADYEILPSYESIILTADSSVRIIGEPITFTVRDSDGNDLTEDAAILVNGEEIDGNTFTSETVGNFEVKAIYYEIQSDPITINFHDGSEINFVKRVLIEDYTGTWCGFCPRVSYAIDLVKAQTDEPLGTAVPVAIHRASSNPQSLDYDPFNYDTTELELMLSASGYPKSFLNRMTLWNAPEQNNLNQAIALTQGENPKLGLALNPILENGNISLDVNIKFGKDFSNLRLVVYVLENGLFYDQTNYYPDLYGGAHTLEDFEHNHVLRQCLTPLLGEPITGNTSIANVYNKTFNIPVPASVVNAANIEFVVFVTDINNNVINVRKADPGEIQEFEQL